MMTKAKIYDAQRMVGYITPAKVINWFKVLTSFYLSKILQRAIHKGQPVSLSIEPTTACNLRCPECPSGLRSFTRATGNLKQDFFRKLIGQANKDLMSLTFYFQGEPYINPHFLEMVQYAHENDIYTVTSTNGHFLDEENCRKTISSGLDRLIVSVDGASQEVYENYRKGGQLSTVLEGIQQLVDCKKKMKSRHPFIILQCLVVKPNEHQIEQIKKLGKDLGVDEVKFKTAQLYDFENGHELMPENTEYARYIRQPNGQYKTKHALSNECWKLWHSAVITWNGVMVPCCFDKDAQHPMGNLQELSLSEIWQGPQAKSFRERIMKGRKEIDICANCSEGCQVWA